MQTKGLFEQKVKKIGASKYILIPKAIALRINEDEFTRVTIEQ